jgi:hypothetical protein
VQRPGRPRGWHLPERHLILDGIQWRAVAVFEMQEILWELP